MYCESIALSVESKICREGGIDQAAAEETEQDIKRPLAAQRNRQRALLSLLLVGVIVPLP